MGRAQDNIGGVQEKSIESYLRLVHCAFVAFIRGLAPCLALLVFIFLSFSVYSQEKKLSHFQKNIQKAQDRIRTNLSTEPLDTLEKLYHESKVLVLASSSHSHSGYMYYLQKLLERIGDDPNLRFVTLENPFELREFHASLSEYPLQKTLRSHPFSSEHSKLNALCSAPEWTYSFANLFPLIRNINRRRPEHKILHAIPIDGGTSVHQKWSWPKEIKPTIQSGSCSFGDRSVHNKVFNHSNNREWITARLFEDWVWKKLRKDEKAIVFFQNAHVTRGFERCNVHYKSTTKASAQIGHGAWIDHFFESQPRAQSRFRFVHFEGKDPAIFPRGVFRLTRELRKEVAQDWIFETKVLQGLSLRRGVQAFEFNPNAYWLSENQRYSELTLKDFSDAVLYIHNAQRRFFFTPFRQNELSECFGVQRHYNGKHYEKPKEKWIAPFLEMFTRSTEALHET